jgi:hypothetical protein
MSSLEPENQDQIDRTNGNGSNIDRDEAASNSEHNGRRVRNNKPEKPNDLKSICYRLLQKIDRSKDLGRSERLTGNESQKNSFIDDRALAAQRIAEMKEKGGLPDDNSAKGVSPKVSFDRVDENRGNDVENNDVENNECENNENESPILDLGSLDAPLAVSMESFFEFNFEISESLDDMVAEFELKNHMHHWNEWGMEDSNVGASDLVFNEGDSNGESYPNPVRSKFPK